MRIVVFGAGALGSLIGGLLSPFHDVTLIGREDHVMAIREGGLRIEGEEKLICHPKAELEPSGKADIILLTVKAHDTSGSIPIIEGMLREGTIVVSLQNGLDNHFLLASSFPGVVTGLTSWGATMLGPGRVRLSGRGDIVLGSLGEYMEGVEKVSQALAKAGIGSRVSDDIALEIWSKVVVNACINPITALLRKENGCLLEPELGKLARELCMEGVNVARAWGIDLDPVSSLAGVMKVAMDTATNRSSMLQDLERGRRTEIDEITGSIVRRGEERGVDTSLNRALWYLVRSAESR